MTDPKNKSFDEDDDDGYIFPDDDEDEGYEREEGDYDITDIDD